MAIELPKAFNPNEHLMQIESGYGDNRKSSDYLPVQWRLVWFRSDFPQGTIKTEMLHIDLESEFSEEKYVWNPDKRKKERIMVKTKGVAIFRAIVEDGVGGVATGTKSERGVSFPDFIEKAETGAIGRALAALGYGTQFTGDELNEGARIADSPVDRKPVEENKQQAQQKQQLPPPEQQDATIKAANSGLYKAALANKKRALKAEIIHNDYEWNGLLDYAEITEFKGSDDLKKLNETINQLIADRQDRQQSQEAKQPVTQAS
jgi:hypothetical protein